MGCLDTVFSLRNVAWLTVSSCLRLTVFILRLLYLLSAVWGLIIWKLFQPAMVQRYSWQSLRLGKSWEWPVLYLSLMKNINKQKLSMHRSPYLIFGQFSVNYRDKHVISLHKWLPEPIRTRSTTKPVHFLECQDGVDSYEFNKNLIGDIYLVRWCLNSVLHIYCKWVLSMQ